MVYKKKDPDRMKTILFTIVNKLKILSILLNPIIPISTNKVLDAMNLRKNDLSKTLII